MNKKQQFTVDGNFCGLLSLLLLSVAIFSILMPGRFFTVDTFLSIAFQLPELGLLTFAMFLPMLTGGLNLTIIGTANLTSLFMAWLLINHIPVETDTASQIGMVLVALIGALVISIAIGMAIGLLVSKIGAHPILVTLGMMTIVEGVGIYLSRGAALTGMPESIRYIGEGTIASIPVSMILFMTVTLILSVFLNRTPVGKQIYLCGSNINATWFSGVRTDRVLIYVYVISSVLCVFAGLVMMARFNSARMGYGDSYLLLTILAIVLGGTNPFGGTGKIGSVFLALVTLQCIATGLSLFGANLHFNHAMWGFILIISMSTAYFKRQIMNAYFSMKLSKRQKSFSQKSI